MSDPAKTLQDLVAEGVLDSPGLLKTVLAIRDSENMVECLEAKLLAAKEDLSEATCKFLEISPGMTVEEGSKSLHALDGLMTSEHLIDDKENC